ncbi:glycosyltransferase [Brachyspira aalborgi]|uniref:Glycosyltransferase n=1 Tax=Brachyspira aalborgi TaxID=29522 RepID=A0A5C8D517_9SPIR|nr:TIGR04282 family arsenosugar biosynthesis glycosyltransferase [Brachyspira aalborgi]TXJ20103.1 glycosyltransferase [Brachyspira aalborgi]
MSKNGLIIFTRIPEAGKTKTRLQSKLSKEECANLHKCFLKDIYDIFLNLNDIDIIICHTEEGDLNILKNIFYKENLYIKQYGNNLNEKMYNAIKEVLSLKYDKCVLIGADIPEINKDDIINAFNLLKNNDFVFGASYDGGYYLVGMKEANDIIFKSGSGNLKDIINIVEANNLKYGLTNKKHDIDEYEDLIDLSKRININDNKLKNTKIFLKEIEVI